LDATVDKRIFFFDVDDTVAPSTKPLSEGMAGQLNHMISSGLWIAFISGSTTEQLWGQLGASLKGDFHILGTSGTAYEWVRSGRREEVYRHSLDQAERVRILKLFKELALRHGIRSLTTEEDQIQDRGSQITFSAIGRHAPEDKKRSFDPERALRLAWARELKAELGDAYQIGIGGTTSLDVTRAGQDKGWGLRQFLKHHGRDASEAVFYGDKLQEGGNDYPARAVMDCVEVLSPEDTLMKLRSLA
jgi:HAD superfamily hydrolase (TIGR01484 family)